MKGSWLPLVGGEPAPSFTIARACRGHISRPINPLDLFFVLINLPCKRGCHFSQDESLLSACCAVIPSHLPWLKAQITNSALGIGYLCLLHDGGKGRDFQGHFHNCLFISFHMAYKRMKELLKPPDNNSREYWCYSTYSWSLKLLHSQQSAEIRPWEDVNLPGMVALLWQLSTNPQIHFHLAWTHLQCLLGKNKWQFRIPEDSWWCQSNHWCEHGRSGPVD